MKIKGFAVILLVVVLIVLFVASSTDLIIKEKQTVIRSVSVLVDTQYDTVWQNFKMGLDKASLEYNVDITFITLYDAKQPEQLKELIRREQERGADGIVLASKSAMNLNAMLAELGIDVPLVIYGGRVNSQKTVLQIEPDWAAMAKGLVDEIYWNEPTSKTVLLVGGDDKLSEYMQQQLTIRNFTVKNTETADMIIPPDHIAVCTEAAGFEKLSENNKNAQNPQSLYGVGWTTGIWHGVDDGTVGAAAVINDYDAGYYAIKHLVEALSKKKRSVGKTMTVGHTIATASSIYRKDSMGLLFPIS